MLPIAGQTAGLIGLNFLCRHSWMAGDCYRQKKSKFFFQKFFFHGKRRALQIVMIKTNGNENS